MDTENPQTTADLPSALEDVKIKGLPSSAFYIANFISPEEERYLLDKVSLVRLQTQLCSVACLLSRDRNSP